MLGYRIWRIQPNRYLLLIASLLLCRRRHRVHDESADSTHRDNCQTVKKVMGCGVGRRSETVRGGGGLGSTVPGGTITWQERASAPQLPPSIKLSCGHCSSAQRTVWRNEAGWCVECVTRGSVRAKGFCDTGSFGAVPRSLPDPWLLR